MKRIVFVSLLVVVSLFATGLSLALAAAGPNGPAPNSGDGIPDGSGLDAPYGLNGQGVGVYGPAPNSGDGIPDGSGF